ncbi:hypothetical protein A5742_07890 [Mycolicibacterium fortuitum]|uniref:Lipoprotein n=2 Tax=Mycolicibacterium fortuitum TaxID=1766 RepID=A0ABD6QGV5_MYCFO|nr:hypothetical protein A5742_07890 [Mycolicibacterium fortuitum]
MMVAVAVLGSVASCGNGPSATVASQSLTAGPSAVADSPPTTTESADDGAQWAETYVDQPMVFSVAKPGSSYPAIDPGMWAGTARNPDPNDLVPCRSWQWVGEDRKNIIGVFGTPIGESKLQFTIEHVPGHVELSGDCDWSGGWDG